MQTVSLGTLLMRQLVPTSVQVFVALVVAAAILLAARITTVAGYLGITNDGVQSVQESLHSQSAGVLASSFASNLVLVTFWGMVGLIAYLVTWGIMNVIIEARNKVTIDTQYGNRGHWRGPWQTLAVKAVTGTLLVLSLLLFKYGLSLWLDLSGNAFIAPSLASIALAAGAWIGLAAQLYLTYLLLVLTITPWYRATAFTE